MLASVPLLENSRPSKEPNPSLGPTLGTSKEPNPSLVPTLVLVRNPILA